MVVILSSLKEEIAKYYETNDEKANFNIQDTIISLLLDNGFKLQDIDNLMVEMLKRPDRAKFKYYLIKKNNYEVKCGVCGVEENLELHHLKSAHKHPELAYDEDNVCFLCVSCHKLIHHGGAKIMDNALKGKIKRVFKQELDRRLKKNNKNGNVLNRLMVYFF